MRALTTIREARRAARYFKTSDAAQTAAGWAAVHEARRGISAAWVAAIVNIAVVAAALAVPYFDRYLKALDRDAELHTAKVMLVPMLQTALDTLKAEHTYVQSVSYLNENGKLDNQTRVELISILEMEDRKSDNLSAQLDRIPDRYPPDIALFRIVGALKRAAEIPSARIENELGRLKWPHVLATRDETPYIPYEMRPDIRLLIDLNSDGEGIAKSGPLVFGSCDEGDFADKCQSYEDDYRDERLNPILPGKIKIQPAAR